MPTRQIQVPASPSRETLRSSDKICYVKHAVGSSRIYCQLTARTAWRSSRAEPRGSWLPDEGQPCREVWGRQADEVLAEANFDAPLW